MSQLQDIDREIFRLKCQREEIIRNIKSLPWYKEIICTVFGGETIDFPTDAEETVTFVLDMLPEKEKNVILLRTQEKKTLRQCGEKFGVSRERIRQIEARAYRKLRTPKISRILLKGKNEISQIEKEKRELFFSSDEYLKIIPIEDFDLSIRAYNCLKRAGLNTSKDVYDFSDRDIENLLKIRNIGMRTAKEIGEKFNIQ